MNKTTFSFKKLYYIKTIQRGKTHDPTFPEDKDRKVLKGTFNCMIYDLLSYSVQVVGNMGDSMEATDPAIKTTLLKCMRQPATTLSVQLAAIQAFRRMSVTDEVTNHIPLLHEESPCFPVL